MAKSLVQCLYQTRHLKSGHSGPSCPPSLTCHFSFSTNVHSRADCSLLLTLQLRGEKGSNTILSPRCLSQGNADLCLLQEQTSNQLGGHSVFTERNSTSQGALNSGGKNHQLVSVFTICIWPQEEPPDSLFCFKIFYRPFDI